MYRETNDRASGESHQPVDPGFDDRVKRMESLEGQRWIEEQAERMAHQTEQYLGGGQEWRNVHHD